jgi:hypothetical protein
MCTFAVSSKGNKTPASTWIGALDPTLSKPNTGEIIGRELQILEAAQAGNIPNWLQQWCPITWEEEHRSITVYILPDFFAIGDEIDWVYTPMNPITAEEIGRTVMGGATLPTRKIVNKIYEQALCYIPALPMSPPDYPYNNSMLDTTRWSVQTAKILRFARDNNISVYPGNISSGHYKNVVIGSGLEKSKGRKVGIYGWKKPNTSNSNGGWAIQGPTVNWGSHVWWYADYSHGVRFCHPVMSINGDSFDMKEVLKHPEYHKFLLDKPGFENTGSSLAPLKYTSYTEAQKA